jgi:hypothetical protein
MGRLSGRGGDGTQVGHDGFTPKGGGAGVPVGVRVAWRGGGAIAAVRNRMRLFLTGGMGACPPELLDEGATKGLVGVWKHRDGGAGRTSCNLIRPAAWLDLTQRAQINQPCT